MTNQSGMLRGKVEETFYILIVLCCTSQFPREARDDKLEGVMRKFEESFRVRTVLHNTNQVPPSSG